MNGKVLILGATGAFGSSVARALIKKGVEVRALVRSFDKARRMFEDTEGIELVPGDPLDASEATAAAEGCSWIVHGINFRPWRWALLADKAMGSVITAARERGAAVLYPGSVYALGPQTGAPVTEGAPNQPTTRKGIVRARVGESLMAAALNGELRALVLRAGDFYGPVVRNVYVNRIFGAAAAGRTPRALGKLEISHQWAFVPDVGRAAAELMDKAAQFLPYEIVNFPGHIAHPQRVFLGMVAEQAGLSSRNVESFPWPLLQVTALFDSEARELLEMRYLFNGALILDGGKFRKLLPDFQDTPIPESIRQTLDDYRKR